MWRMGLLALFGRGLEKYHAHFLRVYGGGWVQRIRTLGVAPPPRDRPRRRLDRPDDPGVPRPAYARRFPSSIHSSDSTISPSSSRVMVVHRVHAPPRWPVVIRAAPLVPSASQSRTLTTSRSSIRLRLDERFDALVTCTMIRLGDSSHPGPANSSRSPQPYASYVNRPRLLSQSAATQPR